MSRARPAAVLPGRWNTKGDSGALKRQSTALLLSSDPNDGPPSPGSASNEDRGRPRQARAKHGVFKSLQNGNLAKPRQPRKAASLPSFSKTRPEPPLACPGERAGRTGLWDPSEAVAERGCFKNVEGARPPLWPRAPAAAAAARPCSRVPAPTAAARPLLALSLAGFKVSARIHAHMLLPVWRHGQFPAPRSPFLPSLHRSHNFQEHGLKAPRPQRSSEILCVFLLPSRFWGGSSLPPPLSSPSPFANMPPSFPGPWKELPA